MNYATGQHSNPIKTVALQIQVSKLNRMCKLSILHIAFKHLNLRTQLVVLPTGTLAGLKKDTVCQIRDCLQIAAITPMIIIALTVSAEVIFSVSFGADHAYMKSLCSDPMLARH
jgi:hypothetical protein